MSPDPIAPRMGPATAIFTPSNVLFKDAIAKAISDELASAPENAVKVSFRFSGADGVTVAAATKVKDVGWLFGADLAAGVYGNKKKDGGWTVGADTVITF